MHCVTNKLVTASSTMPSLALVSVVLLVYYAGVCASQDNNVNPATHLGEDIKKLLKEAMAEYLSNLTYTCDQHTSDHTTQVQTLADSVEELEGTIKSTTNELLEKVSFLVTPGYTPNFPASCCQEILDKTPGAPSGYYWIRGTGCCSAKHMYCDMDRVCKNVTGPWMRVASIDMTNTSSTCPSGLTTLTSPRRLCSRNIYYPGCSSVVFPVHGIKYSKVCGKIIGYQMKTPDAFRGSSYGTPDSNYVDGISLTYGQNPREHIWTFAGALHEDYSHLTGICPCINTSITPPPPVPGFIGNDYFCETASRDFHRYIFFEDDPLWDGAGCGEGNTCCTWNSPPWFCKTFSPPTSDDIEMRLCADQYAYDEDINFESVEIYVM